MHKATALLLFDLFEDHCLKQGYVCYGPQGTFSPRDLKAFTGTYYLLEHETGEGSFIEERVRTETRETPVKVIVDRLRSPEMAAWLQGAASGF